MTKEIILTILGSGAFFSFIQFLITLYFNRKDKLKVVEKKLDVLDEKIDVNQAILARTHILRFNDEIKNGWTHSEEYFRQQLDDCDTYDEYCATHPGFKNSYTTLASQNIKEAYKDLMHQK